MAAGTWLNEQPAGPRLDSALASYASTVSRDDAGSAMEWAVSISEEKLQQKTIRSVGQEWYRQDKDAVETWLPESGLSEDLQKVSGIHLRKTGGKAYAICEFLARVVLKEVAFQLPVLLEAVPDIWLDSSRI